MSQPFVVLPEVHRLVSQALFESQALAQSTKGVTDKSGP